MATTRVAAAGHHVASRATSCRRAARALARACAKLTAGNRKPNLEWAMAAEMAMPLAVHFCSGALSDVYRQLIRVCGAMMSRSISSRKCPPPAQRRGEIIVAGQRRVANLEPASSGRRIVMSYGWRGGDSFRSLRDAAVPSRHLWRPASIARRRRAEFRMKSAPSWRLPVYQRRAASSSHAAA